MVSWWFRNMINWCFCFHKFMMIDGVWVNLLWQVISVILYYPNSLYIFGLLWWNSFLITRVILSNNLLVLYDILLFINILVSGWFHICVNVNLFLGFYVETIMLIHNPRVYPYRYPYLSMMLGFYISTYIHRNNWPL